MILGGFYLSLDLCLISVSKAGAVRDWKGLSWQARPCCLHRFREKTPDAQVRDTDSRPKEEWAHVHMGSGPQVPYKVLSSLAGEHAPGSHSTGTLGSQGPLGQVGSPWPVFALEGEIALSFWTVNTSAFCCSWKPIKKLPVWWRRAAGRWPGICREFR